MGLTYLALGDSTTVATTPGKCYPHLLAKYIKDNYTPLIFVHKGTGGLKGADFSVNPWYYSNFSADIVTVGIGFNDVSNGEAGIANFKLAIKALIDRLRSRNPAVKIILCTANNGSGTTLQMYREALVDVATEKNVYCCRFEEAWNSSLNGTYTADGVHPTESGQILLFGLLKPIVDLILS